MLAPFLSLVLIMSQSKRQLRGNGFTFKRFFIAHDRCAMKVGTDSILLGAWAPVAQAARILDIGSGSGLLALMLAQRTSETVAIDAVELDGDAAAQAAENVARSPWAQRIHIHQADILDWAMRQERRYSLIVSNPPYFTPGPACASSARDKARATHTLHHESLLHCAEMLIGEDGFFCLVLPEEEGKRFVSMALARGWHLRFRNDVAENSTRLPHRVLLGFSPAAGELLQERMVIRGPDQRYSPAFCSLTQDFYLFM
ncbi:tRNA1(Val) (adenine(37)-N6)-methyltransferase [Mixta theicola]|nr:tRNA1(Val) (adenine(37)-N6)-methyltransferase [Mixta theicola]GLR10418.1 tRNA1(Val) (adenine(37)-N6)-methyltransferase [Mixta theicola]